MIRYNVDVAGNGEDAINKLDSQGIYDIVLMDIKCLYDGLTATKHIDRLVYMEIIPIYCR